jgi:hypothetical protein
VSEFSLKIPTIPPFGNLICPFCRVLALNFQCFPPQGLQQNIFYIYNFICALACHLSWQSFSCMAADLPQVSSPLYDILFHMPMPATTVLVVPFLVCMYVTCMHVCMLGLSSFAGPSPTMTYLCHTPRRHKYIILNNII